MKDSSRRKFSSEVFQNGAVELKSLVLKDIEIAKGNDEDDDYIDTEEYYAPEGLWGWIIVASAFCTNFVVDGISLSYSVMTNELTAPKDATSGNVSKAASEAMTLTEYNTVGSTLLAVTLLMGPFASGIAEKIGFRITAMCGSVLATIGIILSWAISPEVPTFYAFLIGFGLFAGIGFGIMFTLSIVIVGLYFEKHRPLATGITVAGTGVGTLAMAPINKAIVSVGGWQGALWFQAGLCALSTLFATVYLPIPKRPVKVRKSELKKLEKIPIREQLRELLTSPSYLIMSFSGSLIMMGYFAPFGFLVPRAEDIIGENDAVLLLTILGATNAIGRVGFGLLATKVGHSLFISNVALTVGGLITATYAHANEHWNMIACSVVFGLYAAVFASLRSIVIMDIVKEKKFNVGFGLSLVFMGFATLGSNTLGAHLKETTETYAMSFYVAGGFLVLSAVICYPLSYIQNWEEKKSYAKDMRRASKLSDHSTSKRKSLYNVHVED